MKDHPKPKHGPRFQIDEWVQSALRGELLAIVENDWLDICHIDRVTRSLDELRLLTSMPERTVPREKLHSGVALLHCVRYEEMSKPTLEGLPAALLQVLGLDDQSGPHFLGVERWLEVEQRFHDQTEYKMSSADLAASCKGRIGSKRAANQNRLDADRKTWTSRLKALLKSAYSMSSMLRNFLKRKRDAATVQWQEPQTSRGSGKDVYEQVHRVSPAKPAVENLIDDFPCEAAKLVIADVMRQRAWPHERLIKNCMHDQRHKRAPQSPPSPKNERKNLGTNDGDDCDDADDLPA